jgi:hypothetical protein
MMSTSKDQPTNSLVERPVVTAGTRARQGVTGQGLRYVLGWGLAGVAIVFIILYFLFFSGR